MCPRSWAVWTSLWANATDEENDEARMTNDEAERNTGLKMNPFHRRVTILLSLLFAAFVLTDCSGSKLTLANYNKITTGMSKAQVEKILGPPKSVDKVDMFIFKKTTYRYEDGKKFAIITFKNDEVDSKDTNLNANP